MNCAVVTGSSGGVGRAICEQLRSNGVYVIGVDQATGANDLDGFIECDISELVLHKKERDIFFRNLENLISGKDLNVLINNAALQVLSSLEELEIEDFRKSLDVNLVAPLVLTKLLYGHLKANKGVVINIGSIHAKLTKPGFISYATSKSALAGLTQSMAVDIGEHVRVNAIQPAAIETDMLLDGFEGKLDSFHLLKKYHPTNTIGTPAEIGSIVDFLVSDKCQFMNGSIIDVNGGIGCRLHDPV